MKIRIIDGIAIDGEHVEPGSELDVDAAFARRLISTNKAEIVDADELHAEVQGPLTTSAAEGLVPEGKRFARKGKA